MNKNLLKKIQDVLGENAGNYCGCFTALRNRRIEAVYNYALLGTPFDQKEFDILESKLPKDFCGKCRKPVDVEGIADYERKLAVTLPSYENYEFPQPVNVGPEISAGAARLARKVNEIPVGMISRLEASERLQIELHDISRHIRSGRLRTDISKQFVSLDSFNELEALIRQRDSARCKLLEKTAHRCKCGYLSLVSTDFFGLPVLRSATSFKSDSLMTY